MQEQQPTMTAPRSSNHGACAHTARKTRRGGPPSATPQSRSSYDPADGPGSASVYVGGCCERVLLDEASADAGDCKR
eukprot:3135280-Prymnesium_polylepis.1